MGATMPQAYRLGNGRIVTPANPALVWSSPVAMRHHDVSVVSRLLAASHGQSSVESASTPLVERAIDDSDTAVYGRLFE